MTESKFITRKEIAAAAEVSEDTLLTSSRMKNVQKAMAETRDPTVAKPIRCNREKLRTRLALYGHTDLAERI